MELKNKNIAVIIAHPDDETIGCGGFLSKATTSGANCKVILPLKRANQRGIRNWDDEISDFKMACHELHVTPIITEELVADNLASFNIQKIASIIKAYTTEADIILCHWQGDTHQAHQAISHAVELSTRPFRNPKTVLCFEIATSTDQGFENTFSPNCFVALSKADIARKKNAMMQYHSEIAPGRSPEDLELLAKLRGRQSGSEYAEAYRIVRHFIR